jgi:DNA-binding PadR family transcriptional regulator
MADKQHYLGEFEEIVLLAIMRLRGNGYGVSIRETVEEVAGRNTSIGAMYTTLERLEQKGLISSHEGEPTPQRGGRAKRYYKIEGPGLRALNEAQRARAQLQEGLDLEVQPTGVRI